MSTLKHKSFGLFSLFLIIMISLTACNLPLPGTGSSEGPQITVDATPPQPVADPATAVIGEAEGDVAARNPDDSDFSAAGIGDILVLNGQLRTGTNSRSRIDFADGTLVRVGPSTTFTLAEISDQEGGFFKRLQLDFGKVWVILNGGSLEVDTPAGVASVRGSYLAVRFNEETGEYWITCLEGTCTMQTEAGEVTLGAGEQASVMGTEEVPLGEPMTDEDFQDWLDNNPEAALVAFDVPNSISNFVWYDLNGDGIQDDGEFGAPGVGVVLFTADEQVVADTSTDENGFYLFPNVEPGDYFLGFIRPTGYAFSPQDQGGFDGFDSDPNAAGYTALFTTTGEAADGWDAGLVEQEVEFGPLGGSMDGVCYGPDLADFPEGVNPLTGLPVSNPDNLNLPAMMLSISNFPVSARPQSGLSFAPIIYEIYIGEGMTRFLSVVYGEFPEASTPTSGNYEPNTEPFSYENNLLGNRVWFDQNQNGVQDPAEIGIEGVAVHLLDNGENILATYYTNPNGFYGFDVLDGAVHAIEVELPPGLGFSPMDQGGNDNLDSDVDPESGKSAAFGIAGNDDTRDIGLFLLPQPAGGAGAGETEAETIAIGDYVWFDANANGVQDEGEFGIPGVLVELAKFEGDSGFQPYAQFVTDVNGNYLFANLPADGDYRVTVTPPVGLGFTLKDQGNDESDSDVDTNGDILLYNASFTLGLNINSDAGMVYAGGNPSEATSGDNSASGGFGPFRSGRLPYEHLLNLFPGGCLVYAGKDPSLDIPVCASVFNSGDEGDINANFLGLERLKKIAAGLNPPLHGVNYSGNQFCYGAPSGGYGVPEWIMYYNSNNQTKWEYDPLSNNWLRYNDWADGSGEFYPSTDRINSSQLQFANVVVMFTPHNVLNGDGTIIDIEINEVGLFGKALLFRNGRVYDIYWTTGNEEWESETGQRRPFKFVDAEGNPIALQPGSTWVHIVTPTTCVADGPNAGACLTGNNQSASAFDGLWPSLVPYLRFFAP
jgi:hypothetical protein